MEIFGIGPLEFVLILVIALVVLGPQGMIKTARQVGEAIRKFIKSPIWNGLVSSTQEIEQAKDKFIRESGIQDTLEELQRSTNSIRQFNPDPFRSSQNTTGTILPPNTASISAKNIEEQHPLEQNPDSTEPNRDEQTDR